MTDDDLIWAGKRGVRQALVVITPACDPPVKVQIVDADDCIIVEHGYSREAVWERACREVDRRMAKKIADAEYEVEVGR